MAGGRNAEGFSDLLMFRVNKLLSDDGYTAGSFAIGLKADEGVSAGVAKPGKASMATIMISSSADLVKAVKSATDGDVIQLAAGDYGQVSLKGAHFEIGRASCRARVCQYVEISVVAVLLKKKQTES